MNETLKDLPPQPSLVDKREVIQEIPYPEFWSVELAQKWTKNIPENVEKPESETPLIEMDLTNEGFGKIFLKNEGDTSINPTGTMKDRMARACAAVYHYEARRYLEILAAEPNFKHNLQTKHLQRFSIITAGNAGRALANAFQNYELPPPKLLLDNHVSGQTLKKLKDMRADLYLTNLSANPFTGKPAAEDPLSPDQILKLTNNEGGLDLTSANQRDNPDQPWRSYYYNLGAEIFSRQPEEVYVPYGSGALFEGLVDKQHLLDSAGHIKIFGAEPESFPSVADKLAAPVKPYVYYDKKNLAFLKQEGLTHENTGVYKISEKEIKEAYELLKKKGEAAAVATEPSASAGLALYMKRWRQGLVNKDNKVIVINTGRGIFV